jgi:hypothetical protein
MSQARRERRQTQQEKEKRQIPSPLQQTKQSARSWALLTLLIVGGMTAFIIAQRHRSSPSRNSVTTPTNVTPAASSPHPAVKLTFGKLVELKPDQLASVDLAEMNLLCASGLPGTKSFDLSAGIKALDEWARIVEREIARNRHRFVENPAEYDHSENLFKMVILILTVQQDLKVHYDAAMMGAAAKPNATKQEIERDLADESYFKNAASIFLTGILSDARTGTCASLPVLYTALGRKLGFPLKLVATKAHLFVRWDDGGKCFNMEGTGGVNSFPDDHYKKWPLPLSQAEIDSGEYLKSLSPAEELAIFLESRAVCFRANGRYDEAMVALAQAYRLDPKSVNRQIGLAKTAEAVTAPLQQRRPSAPPEDPLAELRRVQEINRANQMRTRPPVNAPANPANPFSRQDRPPDLFSPP